MEIPLGSGRVLRITPTTQEIEVPGVLVAFVFFAVLFSYCVFTAKKDGPIFDVEKVRAFLACGFGFMTTYSLLARDWVFVSIGGIMLCILCWQMLEGRSGKQH